MNLLDTFLANGNQHFAATANDSITWNGSDYACTVSDLEKDEFFVDEGTGKRRNAERLLEFWREAFTGSEPQIKDVITYDGDIYELIEIESKDTTNLVFRIRWKMEDAS